MDIWSSMKAADGTIIPCILTVGDSTHKISVGGKIFHFEMHSYCGPMPTDAKGNELKNVPQAFWEAVTFWAQQGKREENGLCVWDRTFEPEPIMKHLWGRNYEIVGYKPARPPEKGE